MDVKLIGSFVFGYISLYHNKALEKKIIVDLTFYCAYDYIKH